MNKQEQFAILLISGVCLSNCTSADLYSGSRPQPANNFGLNANAAIEYVTAVCLRAEREERTVDELMKRWPRPIRDAGRTGYPFLDRPDAGPTYRLNGTSVVLIGDHREACHLVSQSGRGPELRAEIAQTLAADPQVWTHLVDRADTPRPDTVRDLWCSAADENGPALGVLTTSRRADATAKEGAQILVTIRAVSETDTCSLSQTATNAPGE